MQNVPEKKIGGLRFFLHRASYKKYILYKFSLGGGVADFGVFFVTPLGIRSDLHVICRGKNFDRKVLHS